MTSSPNDRNIIQQTAGLANYGNFCYLNSSIQCLRVLKPLIQYFNECCNTDEIITEFFKKFATTNINKVKSSKKLYRTVAYYLDQFFTNNPDENDPYINPDEGKVIALEDIYGKNPPSELIQVEQNVSDNTVKVIMKIKEKHNISRQHVYNIIRKLALHLEKVYLFILLKEMLVDMELCGQGKAPSVIDPKNVITALHIATRDNIEYNHLCNGQQNDASELITVLLDFLHEAFAYPTDMGISQDILSMSSEDMAKLPIKEQITAGICQSAQRQYSHSYTSLVNRMFFFTLQVTRCGNSECDSISLSYTPDNTLSIPIYIEDLAKQVAESSQNIHNTGQMPIRGPLSHAHAAAIKLRQTTLLEYRKMGNRRSIELAATPISVYNCLDEHFKTDYLDDYKCEKCENKNGNHISRALVNLPNVLIISLKRFQTIDNFGNRAKVYRRVTYPMILDISKYCASPIENGCYSLVGVNMHSGGVDGGHYTSMAFNEDLDKWFLYNDSHVRALDTPADALNHMNAYILFYKKL